MKKSPFSTASAKPSEECLFACIEATIDGLPTREAPLGLLSAKNYSPARTLLDLLLSLSALSPAIGKSFFVEASLRNCFTDGSLVVKLPGLFLGSEAVFVGEILSFLL